jgi:hypothetical protein
VVARGPICRPRLPRSSSPMIAALLTLRT